MARRDEAIRKRLVESFSPQELQVKDQSHLHAGHPGAKTGKGHFEVTIVADAFTDKTALARHRMIYAALEDLMQSDIHALSIHAFTPAERC